MKRLLAALMVFSLVGCGSESEVEVAAKQAAAVIQDVRVQEDQTAAIEMLKHIEGGQTTYALTCGQNFYAPDLAALSVPPPGESMAYISPDLKPMRGTSVAVRGRYRFEVKAQASPDAPASCNGVPRGAGGSTWHATAVREAEYPGKSYRISADGEVTVLDSGSRSTTR
jgi:hypothetical protein